MNKPLYKISRFLLRVYAAFMLRLDIKHITRLPAGPKLFVANHPSATDPFLIHLVAPEALHVMITAKAFQVPLFGSFLHRVGEIPVSLTQASTALVQAGEVLRRGRSVAIFIEGQISPVEGGFLPPRLGAAWLALNSGVPVIPVGISLHRKRCRTIRSSISGSPSEARWYLRGPYSITLGKALHFNGSHENREHIRKFSDVIMDKIRLLAGDSDLRLAGA